MAKKTEKRKLIGLVCDACGHRHYYTVKNTQNTTDKIELNKYCPKQRSTAKQVETKKNLGVNVVKKRKG
jgi:large subunit ribosomal protein L33